MFAEIRADLNATKLKKNWKWNANTLLSNASDNL